jgi:outer membrane protein assembly factor BamB
MKRLALLLSLVAVLVVSSVSRAADWPTWQYDNSRRGASPESLAAPLSLQWVYTAPAPPEMAWSGPRDEPIEGKLMRNRVAYDRAIQVVSAGGKAFFGSSVDNKVYAIDAATGDVLWTAFTAAPNRLAPTYWQGKLYVGSDDGHVYCFDADSGDIVWKRRVGPEDERLLARGRMISRWPVRTGVMIEDGIAYFGAGVFPHETVYLMSVKADTGEVVWRNDHISQEDAGRNDLSPQGYLLTSGELLFVPSGRSLPAAFNRASGEDLYKRTHSWRTTAGGVVGGYKAVLADGQIYTSGPHHFLAMDQKTGSVGYAWITGTQLVIADDKGFIADGRRIAAMDRAAHTKATVERQEFNLQLIALQRARRSMKPEVYQEKYAELQKKIAELSEVGVLWSTPTADNASLIAIRDKLAAGGVDHVALLDAATGEVVWEAKVDGEADGLAASDGRLYVCTDQGKIYCFATPAAGKLAQTRQIPGERVSQPFAEDDLSEMYRTAAKEILERTKINRGFCLVVGSEKGRLAYELARQSKLRVYGVEGDAAKVAASRDALEEAGLYGSRVTIIHGDPSAMPVSNYFANLVVSDSLLLTGRLPGDPAEITRCVKPCGGMLYVGAPASAPGTKALTAEAIEKVLRATPIAREGEIKVAAGHGILTRGKLPGAGAWSHQYGNVANTSMSDDYRVKGGMGVLWYGDPGPAPMINRHEAAAAPLSTNGRMFIQGVDNIMCYDAYNGLFLWEYKDPGAIRTGVFNNEETSNLAASDDYLFVSVDDSCTVIDAPTGEIVKVHKTPPARDKIPRVWGYVAYYDGMLLGTNTIRKELEAALRRRGHTVEDATDGIFAVDPVSGKQQWMYRGENIMDVTIAVDDGRMFFIESTITQKERDELLAADKSELKKLPPEEAKKKEEELKKLDVRRVVALDAHTGEKLWAEPVDVTNCSHVGIGGGELTVMVHDGHVVVCGANANGHYWRQFLSGQFNERRIVVLDAESGEKLWDKDANYRHRPIIVGDEVFAEPWAFELHTGEEKTRQHPLTGEEVKWQFSRPGHHCGPITATPNTLFFRSGYTGYYDLYSDSGAAHFAGHRTGCWINVLPANGLVMIPEASAGCVCQFSIASTVVLEPREERKSWNIYSAQGTQTPVKRLAINFGAPGDRRDSFGGLWLGYPRPKTVGRLEYDFTIPTTLAEGGRYVSLNSESAGVTGGDVPWLFSSSAEGLLKTELTLLGKDDEPAAYKVKLYFAELDDVAKGDRAFTVKLNGEVVAEDVNIAAQAGVRTAYITTYEPIEVERNLTVELIPRTKLPPVLSAIEVTRE